MGPVRFNTVGGDRESDSAQSEPNRWLERLRRLGVAAAVLLVVFLLLPQPWQWRIGQAILPPPADMYRMFEHRPPLQIGHADGTVEHHRWIACSAGAPATFDVHVRRDQYPIPQGSEGPFELVDPSVIRLGSPGYEPSDSGSQALLIEDSEELASISIPGRGLIIGSSAVARLRIEYSSLGTLTIIDELAGDEAVVHQEKIERPSPKHRCEVSGGLGPHRSISSFGLGCPIMEIQLVVDAAPGPPTKLVEYCVTIIGVESGE